MEKIVTAVDIGTSKIVCIAGTYNEGKYRILAAAEERSEGVKYGEIVNITSIKNIVTRLFNKVKDSLSSRNLGSIEEVIIGLGDQNIRCKEEYVKDVRANKDKPITIEEIDGILQKLYNKSDGSEEEYINIIPQSYDIDVHMGETNPVGVFGSNLKTTVKIMYSKRSSIEHAQQCLSGLPYKSSKVVLDPIACAEAVLSDDEKEMGVALLDIGGGTTKLVICQNNIIRHIAVIPLGGNIITEDIKEGCCVTSLYAEALKRQWGFCFLENTKAYNNTVISIPGIGGREKRIIDIKTLSGIIRARLDDIMEGVIYEIEQYGYKDSIKAGIVVTGGSALLKGLPEYIRYMTGFDVRIGGALRTTGSSDLDINVNSVSYSNVVGLITQGFDESISYKSTLLKKGQEAPVSDTLFPIQDESGDNKKDKLKAKKKESSKSKGILTHLKESIEKVGQGAFFDDNDFTKE